MTLKHKIEYNYIMNLLLLILLTQDVLFNSNAYKITKIGIIIQPQTNINPIHKRKQDH